MPEIGPVLRAIVAGGAVAGFAGKLMVNAGEMFAGVDVGNGAGVDEVIAQALADADEKEQHGGDASEDDGALALGAECATRLAFGNGVAACAIGERAVFAFAAAGFRARAGPVAFGFAGLGDESWRALEGGAAFAFGRRTDAAGATFARMAAFPIHIGADVFVGGELR